MGKNSEFIPDLTKKNHFIIKKSKRLYGFDVYQYKNEDGLILKEDEICYDCGKEIILSTKFYKYIDEDFYCKDIYYFFGSSCPSVIQYKKNNKYMHNPIGPALLEFDEYGILRKCSYFVNNMYHRLNGPAIEWYDDVGDIYMASYYIDGEKVQDELKIAIMNSFKEEN